MIRSRRVGIRYSLNVALALVLVAGAALAYFGLAALREKEAGLRTNYAATIALVSDRLSGAFISLESDVTASLKELPPLLSDREAAHAWLSRLAAHPWLEAPFLIRDGRLMATHLEVEWQPAPDDVEASDSQMAVNLAEAERVEFQSGDLEGALRAYRQTRAGTRPAQALIDSRVGRTLFKLHRFEDGMAVYRRLLTAGSNLVDGNGLPFAVIARTQIADGLTALGRTDDRVAHDRDLLRYLVDHPWNVNAGYGYYLSRALERTPDTDAARPARLLQSDIGTLEWLRDNVVPAVRQAHPANAPLRMAVTRGPGRPIVMAYRLSTLGGDEAFAGYVLKDDVVAQLLTTRVLSGINLGKDVDARLLVDGPDRAASPPLATADLSATLPGWQVGLFDRRGRSIEQLVSRERWTYGGLITAMLAVLLAGVAFSARASAREAELARLRTDFVSNVSHELKTPLALIRMFGETLESGLVADPEKRQEFSAVIRRESERLTYLINNVLDAARIEAGTKRYTVAEVDVVRLVRETVDAYRPFFDRLGFGVTLILPPGPVGARVDADAITQALVNLFQNAIKYSLETKSVSVSVSSRDDMVCIAVTDRGVGIPDTEQPRIFDKYYRVPDGCTATAGSGLGLAIVRHAVEAHGGRVTVESAVGHGSTFTLLLPGVRTADVRRRAE